MITAPDEWTRTYGAIVGGKVLRELCGHRSYASFHKAVRENTLGFPVFDLPGRKGKFARTADVVAWLTALTGPKQPSKAVKRRVTATPVEGASLNGRKARVEEVNRGAKDRARPAVKKPD